MSKAGFFDPWRQEAPAPPPENPFESSPAPEEHCVRFRGATTGIHVWLRGSTWEPEKALTQAHTHLVSVVLKLSEDPEKIDTLKSHGVTMKPGGPTSFQAGIFGFSVDAPTRKRAIDQLVSAFRALSASEINGDRFRISTFSV